MTEAEKKAKKKYRDKGKRLTIDFYPSEADLIEQVEKQPNKQGYIKALIRADKDKQKGRWAFIGENCCVCSVCNKSSIVDYYFCPECGSEMERGGEDAAD